MTNRELKSLIKEAYPIKAQRKAAFLRRYETRKLRYFRLLFMQLKYMGAGLAVSFGYLLAAGLGILTKLDFRLARLSALFLPVIALIMLSGLIRSDHHKMSELEMSTRFSFRMICVMRLLIAGIAALLVLLVQAVFSRIVFGTDLFLSFAFAGIPYLLTSSLCMILIRKWHSENNIYGCAVIAGLNFLTEPCLEGLLSSCSAETGKLLIFTLLAGAILMILREMANYMKESEELQWNLC